jgi:hypothetical protein
MVSYSICMASNSYINDCKCGMSKSHNSSSGACSCHGTFKSHMS